MSRPMPGPRQHDLDRHPHTADGNPEMMCGLCWLAELGTPDPHRKHLTDTECAAHAWQSALGWMRADIGRGMGFPSDEMKYEIWRRFSILPHALEVTP